MNELKEKEDKYLNKTVRVSTGHGPDDLFKVGYVSVKCESDNGKQRRTVWLGKTYHTTYSEDVCKLV